MTDIHPLMRPLTTLTATDMAAVTAVIDETLMQGNILSQLVGKHILHAGGKRLRPLLLVSITRMCGYKGDEHIGPSACMELLHSASLLHDDVIDESTTRRGRETVHTLWGNKRSILVGDYFFAQTLSIMNNCKVEGVIERLAWCSSMLAQGELLQLYWQNHLVMEEAQYLDILRHKTAALFSVAAVIGGMIAGRSSQDIAYFHNLGEEIGMAFQIMDDLLDYLGDENVLKKDKGRDFAEKKMTYPIIMAIASAQNQQEKKFWETFLNKNKNPLPDQHCQALELMEKHAVFEKVRAKLSLRLKKAREILLLFEDNPYRAGLLDFLSYCGERAT